MSTAATIALVIAIAGVSGALAAFAVWLVDARRPGLPSSERGTFYLCMVPGCPHYHRAERESHVHRYDADGRLVADPMPQAPPPPPPPPAYPPPHRAKWRRPPAGGYSAIGDGSGRPGRPPANPSSASPPQR